MGVRHTIKLGRTSQNIEKIADLVKRKLALELFAELLQTTPVDTGRARAGWNLGPMLTANVPPKDKSGYGYDVSMNVNPAMAPQNAPISTSTTTSNTLAGSTLDRLHRLRVSLCKSPSTRWLGA